MKLYEVDTKRINNKLNLEQYKQSNLPFIFDNFDINLPDNDIYILRMCLSRQEDFDKYYLPNEFNFIKSFIDKCIFYQNKYVKIKHPFMYLTIRKGNKQSKTTDEWHVDGFSMKYNHLPEMNYIWVDNYPTLILRNSQNLGNDFDPLIHNIHKRFKGDKIAQIIPKTIYGLDPYVIHKRPSYSNNRCFIRLSFTPIKIKDINNTNNILLPNIKYDGVKNFRNKLK